LTTVASVTVTLESPNLGAGLGTRATATLRDGGGNVLTGRTVAWSSSTPSVATVTAAGVISALVAGTTTITGWSEGQTGQANLTVTVNPVQTVTVTLANANLSQGSTTQATATIRDAGGNALSGRVVTWSSAALGVATVTAVGTVGAVGAVTAVGPGAVLITATCEGKSGQAIVNVSADPVASVTVKLTSPRVGVGQVSQGAAILRDVAGDTLSGRTVTWTSSAPGVATVTNTGVVRAVGLGSATLTATADGVSGAATLTVTAMYAVTAVSQTSAPSNVVIQAPGVKVTDGSGAPLSGITVNFSVTSGGGTVSPASVVTDANGLALLTSWTFGPAGAQSVTASASAGPDVNFSGLSRPTSAGFDVTFLFVTPMTASQKRAFVDAKERIQELIIGDVPDIDVNLSAAQMAFCGGPAINQVVDDVIIVVEISPIDGVGNVLGQAGPCYVRSGTPGFPTIGHMQFDSSDVPAREANGDFPAIVLHEMMHVLGFGGLWPKAGYLAGETTTTPYFTGPGAISAFDTFNGGLTYPGSKVPVEGTGGAGTAYSHWRESDLDDEIMTGFLDSNVLNPFSATTVASMADLGYTVDITRADPFRWGATTVALRAALLGADPRIHLVNDVRKEPMRVLGPDGKPLFP
jgi:hypothetical protein